MVAKWRDGYEVVYGVRDNRETDSLPKRLTADLYYRAHNWLSTDKIPEHAGDFRLLDRAVVDVIQRDARAQPLHEGPVRLGRASGRPRSSYHRDERDGRQDQVPLLEAVDAGDRRHHLGLDHAAAHLELSRRRRRLRRLGSMPSSSSSGR